jgi:pyruvate dehydrogenase complex dehydrogenase (E1) component
VTPTPDVDPDETAEWLDALDSLVERQGKARAKYLLERLAEHAQTRGVQSAWGRISPYRNTISVAHQPRYPGNLELEERLLATIRWNALAMVARANHASAELGGHIASYASAADLFEVGFNHFFKAEGHPEGMDLVYFQPHSSPGVYARAFLEGFLDEEHLRHYRQEITGHGLCSYPHPWLMPDFWQFPTGSMGNARDAQGELAARELLKNDWGIEAQVWSVTSYVELHRNGIECERWMRLHPEADTLQAFVTQALATVEGPVVAASDYVRAVPELIRAFVPRRYVTLGTDGFGRSDTRAALRAFFEVDAVSIAIAALKALADDELIGTDRVTEAIERYGRAAEAGAPWAR